MKLKENIDNLPWQLCMIFEKKWTLWRALKSFLATKTWALIHKAKKGDVNAYKALMDSAYGGVKQSLELTEAETPIFKQLDIDVIE